MPSESPKVATRALREVLGAFEPEAFSGSDCAILAEELAQTEKACAAARARAAARAVSCEAHRGFGGANEWLARISGTSAGQARQTLETVAALEGGPQTRDAVVAGELSLAQGAEIIKTEAACPGSEAELVRLAKASSLGVLKDTARSRRLKADDPEDLHRRQHQARALRHWTDDQGMVHLSAALPPWLGVPIVNRLEAETDRIRTEARRRGSDELRAAHAADALVKMLNGQGKGRADRADLVIVYDRSAAATSEENEGSAHIVGGGPIPPSEAKRQAERAFIKAVIHDGKRIETVQHLGRKLPAELRTALELGDPAEFNGLICTDCGRRYGIQHDHIDPVANRGLTSYDNLTGRCWDCHEMKTEQDRQAGLLDGNRQGKDANPNGSAGPHDSRVMG